MAATSPFTRTLLAWPAALLLLGLSLPSRAQSGLAAEGFQPAAGAHDLLAARSPGSGPERFSAAAGVVWAWRVLGLEQEGGDPWLIRQRLLLFGGLEAWPAPRLRLGLLAAGAAWQQGTRTDSFGQAEPLSAGMGEAWLSVLAKVAEAKAFSLGLELGLRLPSAGDSALTGDPSAGSRFALLLETKAGPLRALLNAALIGRRHTFFRDLERAPAWQAAAGLEIRPESWPVAPSVEILAERALRPSPGYRSAQLEVFAGCRFGWGDFALTLGAASGVLGAGAPAARVVFRLGWSGHKSLSPSE